MTCCRCDNFLDFFGHSSLDNCRNVLRSSEFALQKKALLLNFISNAYPLSSNILRLSTSNKHNFSNILLCIWESPQIALALKLFDSCNSRISDGVSYPSDCHILWYTILIGGHNRSVYSLPIFPLSRLK